MGVNVGFLVPLPTRILRHGAFDDGTVQDRAFLTSLSKSKPETTSVVVVGAGGGGHFGFGLRSGQGGGTEGDADAMLAKLENNGKKLVAPFWVI
jgi:hypothetical protein